ncbi:MAG: thiazole biosynthesis adenylyltransferase ThiF [Planctomycetes bacterium]|jgi:adenylyltransferase/sulfurtransferase|nr:thiazole biosynthesis adenylyltransferase ThiF [Planctomycetota bacterium]MBT4028554.1 thiazole biosynthesis adenylyltransferase ThiF [Planctomycetota bacterium]MBT4559446.1 thiazole biosynthesis adenylyltransferase ThiF [Planctomycetota bacterium]MBT5101748.1 thiazole biosynthesis adenylyltransferase ThiF [Planctomycetota bacterium]MBT7013063.1 thiazole biosynthesis adenylyltransferase ThiF [Planctomycetota bacterium]
MADFPSRYERQERLPQVGKDGQKQLEQSHAVVIGLGALGSVESDLLARAGVGRLTIIDRDVVEAGNLQRQTLYTEADALASRPKAEAALSRLQLVNSQIEIRAQASDLTAQNVSKICQGADVVIDGTDNFQTRYLLNDWAVSTKTPFVYAGVVGTYGMSGAILPNRPCLRCTWPEPPEATQAPTCSSAGVLGSAVSTIAGLAVTEAIKVLLSQPDATASGYVYADLWRNQYRTLKTVLDPDCPCCAQNDFAWLSGRRGALGAKAVCGGNAVQIPAAGGPVALASLAARIEPSVSGLRLSDFHLRFHHRGCEVTLFADGHALVRHTEDLGLARAILAEFLAF